MFVFIFVVVTCSCLYLQPTRAETSHRTSCYRATSITCLCLYLQPTRAETCHRTSCYRATSTGATGSTGTNTTSNRPWSTRTQSCGRSRTVASRTDSSMTPIAATPTSKAWFTQSVCFYDWGTLTGLSVQCELYLLCSHVTKFSLSPIFTPILFCIRVYSLQYRLTFLFMSRKNWRPIEYNTHKYSTLSSKSKQFYFKFVKGAHCPLRPKNKNANLSELNVKRNCGCKS